jgi:hypothetical protein
MLITGTILSAQSFYAVTYDDKASQNGTSFINKVEDEEKIGGKTVKTFAFDGKVTTKYQYGFAGAIFIAADDETAEALWAAKGIKFKVVGDGKRYRFKAETPGGADNHYGKEFATKKDQENTVTIMFNTMAQEPYWGEKKPFKADEIKQLQIQTIGQPISSFKFKIYDFEFVK